MTQKQLIVIGDSSVYGWGDSQRGGWCERLRLHWMRIEGNPVVYPLGIRGDGIENVAQRWYQEWKCRGELRRNLPKGMLLSIGLNDTARIGRQDGRPQLSKDAFRYGMEELLKKIKQQTYIMVIGITPVDESKMPFAQCLWYSNSACFQYERLIEECCLELDIPFLPIYLKMSENPKWMELLESDGIHLNELGHEWIFQSISNWEPLKKWALNSN